MRTTAHRVGKNICKSYTWWELSIREREKCVTINNQMFKMGSWLEQMRSQSKHVNDQYTHWSLVCTRNQQVNATGSPAGSSPATRTAVTEDSKKDWQRPVRADPSSVTSGTQPRCIFSGTSQAVPWNLNVELQYCPAVLLPGTEDTSHKSLSRKLGVVVYFLIISTWEAEAGGALGI